jgi:hypothetical protein
MQLGCSVVAELSCRHGDHHKGAGPTAACTGEASLLLCICSWQGISKGPVDAARGAVRHVKDAAKGAVGKARELGQQQHAQVRRVGCCIWSGAVDAARGAGRLERGSCGQGKGAGPTAESTGEVCLLLCIWSCQGCCKGVNAARGAVCCRAKLWARQGGWGNSRGHR